MWRTATVHARSGIRSVNVRPGKRRLCTSAQPATPPPPKPKKGGALKFVALATGLVGTGTVAYAWYDPKFRDMLTSTLGISSAPSPEEPKPWPLPKTKKTVEKKIEKKVDEQVKAVEGKPVPVIEPSPLEPKPLISEQKKKEEEKLKAKKEKQLKEEEQKRLKEQKEKQEKLDMEKKIQEEARISEKNTALTESIERLSADVAKKVEEALELQHQYIEKIKTHSRCMQKAMDSTTLTLSKDEEWKDAAEAFNEKKDVAKLTDEKVNTAREELEKLKAFVLEKKEDVEISANRALEEAQEYFSKMFDRLDHMTNEIANCQTDSYVAEFEEHIKKAKTKFEKELESYVSDLKPGFGRSIEDMNMMIAHAYNHIEQIQLEMAELRALQNKKIEAAVEQQRLADEERVTNAINREMKILEKENAAKKGELESAAHAKFEKEARQMLARQAAAHSDHIQDVLSAQQKKLTEQFEQKLQEKLIEELMSYKADVSAMVATTNGTNAAVEAYKEKDKSGQQAEELWRACLALKGAIRTGGKSDNFYGEWEEQMIPLEEKVMAVAEASGHNPFVATVINTIPEEAMARGVWTESNLKARFRDVKNKCRKVALVDENGGSLFTYLLSNLQAILVRPRVYLKAETDTVDLKDLDTFAIIDHAQYWLEQDNLELALRFMNQLEGQPRVLASDWIKEARLLLETKQAEQSISTFASATGLRALF